MGIGHRSLNFAEFLMSPQLGPYAFLPDFLEFMIHGDRAILAAAAILDPDKYHHDFNISAGSLHKLLVHAMGAQIVWLSRFTGTPVTQFPSDSLYPTLQSIQEHWPKVHAELRDFVAKQTLESLQRVIHFKTMRGDAASGQLGQLLLHVTDHGTYHRGQENTLIKLAGGTPVSSEVFYYRWRVEHPL
jgi:uncharacterized damage-inducible protein DinB